MKTTLSFGLVIAAAGTLFACSSDEGTPRPIGGGAGSPSAGVGGSGGGAGPGTGAGGRGGAPVTGGGGSAGTPSTSNLGTALVIGELAAGNAPVTDSTTTTGINGAAYLVQSQLTATLAPTTPATFTSPPNKVCMAGNTVLIPGTPPNYGEYWGAEIDLDLNRGANPDAVDAGAAGDAGDAGAPVLGQTALAWTPPANVLGFSFTIDGPTVPAALRFKTTPTGSNPSSDNFCANLSPVSGGTYEVRLDQLVRNCFDNPPGAPVLTDPAGYTTLQNLGWQVSASPTEAFMFDFCISNIRPILAAP